MTKEELVNFEREVANLFEQGRIKAPVHLHGSNEEALIKIFQHIKPSDWVFSTHRSHYHALLHGVPPELVKAEILKGNSICLQFPEYRFHTSAIVGGILPIAVGVAMAGEKAWCFIGDMAAETGIFHECQKYAKRHDLPITFVIEDNGYSVNTPTDKAWGERLWLPKVIRYDYKREWPHQGSGKWVTL